jgi:hypothetical protein
LIWYALGHEQTQGTRKMHARRGAIFHRSLLCSILSKPFKPFEVLQLWRRRKKLAKRVLRIRELRAIIQVFDALEVGTGPGQK